jgi:hypothetical protein
MAIYGRLSPINQRCSCVHSLGTTLWTNVDLGAQRQGALGIRCGSVSRFCCSPQPVHRIELVVHKHGAPRHAVRPAETPLIPIIHRTDDDVRVSNDGDNKASKAPVSPIDWTHAGLENYSGMMAAHVGRVWKVGAA